MRDDYARNTRPEIYSPFTILPSTVASYVPGNFDESASAMPLSPATPRGFSSKTSSHVSVFAGNSTTVFAGTRTVTPFTWIKPPAVLQPSGLGGLAGVGFALGRHIWSTEANSMK